MKESEQQSNADKLIVKAQGDQVLVAGREEASTEGQTRVKVRIDNQGRIVIPAFVREELNIAANDTFWLIADSKSITLRKIEHKETVTIQSGASL